MGRDFRSKLFMQKTSSLSGIFSLVGFLGFFLEIDIWLFEFLQKLCGSANRRRMKICGLIRLNVSQLPKVMQVLMAGNVNPNSASVEGEKSGQGTDTTLQDEIDEPVERNVNVSEMTKLLCRTKALLMVYTSLQVCFPLCF